MKVYFKKKGLLIDFKVIEIIERGDGSAFIAGHAYFDSKSWTETIGIYDTIEEAREGLGYIVTAGDHTIQAKEDLL